MNLQQCPRFAAERATTGRLNLARKGVVEKLLNLGAVRVIAWVLSACDGVQQKLHGTIDLRLSTLSLSLRDGGAIADGATLPHEWMLVTGGTARQVSQMSKSGHVSQRHPLPGSSSREHTLHEATNAGSDGLLR